MGMQARRVGDVGVAPLVGNEESEEARWLGALFGKLLTEHLSGAGLPTRDYNIVARQIAAAKHSLPLDATSVEALRNALKLDALVHGRYVVYDQGRMLGLQLIISAPDVPPVPLEVSFPAGSFALFVERITLTLAERLAVPVDDALRQRVKALPRPASFEAFRQVAQARAAWARGEKELALAAVSSALTLDPDYEEAASIEVAIARDANDATTAQDAFRRWAAIAVKRGRSLVGAERLMLLGHWLRERGEWAQAQRAYEDARSLYERGDDTIGVARALNNIAALDLLEGRIQDAIKTFRRNLRLFESSPDAQPDVAVTYFNLSLAHKQLGQREQAVESLEKAHNLALEMKDARLQAHCLAQRGALHDDAGEWARAEADYAQAGRLLDALGDEMGLAIIKGRQAVLFKRQGHYERAEALMLEALETLEQQPDPHERAVVWLNLADLYFAMGLHDRAWSYAQQAKETFARLQSGWVAQAEELVATLEDIMERRGAPSSLPGRGLVPPPPFAKTEEDDAEGLYNADESYDNENAGEP